jgi:hypothetical protein
MTALYFKRETCRLCGSSALDLAVPLAPMPIATPNFAVPDADRNHPVFREAVPLELHVCRDCGLLQVLHIGNPEIQYRNYVYTTSLSLGLPEHFLRYAEEVVAKIAMPKDSLVVELGSNDGTLLRAFKAQGMRVQGVDPARAIAMRATEAGTPTIPDFFGARVAAEIRTAQGPASLMIANNVIANIDNLDDWTAGVRTLLAPDGVFIFETQYGSDVITSNLLDTVYHEHLTYFTMRPLEIYFRRHGLEVIDVQNIWTKGGSIRVYVQLAGGPRAIAPAVAKMIEAEFAEGLYGPERYQRYVQELADLRRRLNEMVDAAHAKGEEVGGYGVSVGTTTLISQFGLTKKIDFLVDDDPNKDKFLSGPGYDIPVVQPAGFQSRNCKLNIVFAWRYVEPIMANNRAWCEKGGKFVTPLPTIKEY